MTRWAKCILLGGVLFVTALLAYQPHFSYPYPLLGDEYVHLSFARYVLEEQQLPFVNPYFNVPFEHTNFESGFHFLLIFLSLLIPDDLTLFLPSLVVIFFVINSLLLFYLVRLWTRDYATALVSVFFFGTIKSASGLLAHQYVIPLTLGVTLLLLLNILFFRLLELPGRRRLFYLTITLFVTALSYPPALFFFLGTTLLFVTLGDHSLHEIFHTTRRRFFQFFYTGTGGSALLFLGALLIFQALDWALFPASWDVVQAHLSPLFFFGLVPSACAAVGLIAVLLWRVSAPILLSWFLFSLGALYFFYVFKVSALIPFPRLFFFYLIGTSILAGIGVTTLFREFSRLMPRRVGVVLVFFIVVIILGIHYTSVWSRPLAHHPILTPPMYEVLKLIEEKLPENSVIVADSITSLAIYPISGKRVVGVLDSNVGGGDTKAAHKFINGTCDEKRSVIGNFDYHIRAVGAERPPIFLLSERAAECDFLTLLYDQGPYLYHLEPRSIVSAIPNPGEDFVLPSRPLLSGAEIEALLSSHTTKSDVWAEYYSPDGRIYGKRLPGGTRYYGFWDVIGDLYCYYYSYGLTSGECFSIAEEAGALSFYDKDGALSSTARLHTGDPENFLDAH